LANHKDGGFACRRIWQAHGTHCPAGAHWELYAIQAADLTLQWVLKKSANRVDFRPGHST